MTTEFTVETSLGDGGAEAPFALGPLSLGSRGVLGDGESAQVLRVAAPDGEVYALKLAHAGMNEVLLREARVLALVGGRGLPRLRRTVVTEDGRVGLLLDLLDGPTLLEAASEGKVDGRRVFEELSGALACLHELGFCHGDVKPENVIVFESRPFLIDAGLARDRSRDEHAVGFTPHYAAPELLARGTAGPLTDAFAFAMTLRECFPDLPIDLAPWLEPREERRLPLKAALAPLVHMRIGLLRVRLPLLERAADDAAQWSAFVLRPDPERGLVYSELIEVFRQLLGVQLVRRRLGQSGVEASLEPTERLVAQALGPLGATERSRFLGFLSGPSAVSFRFRGTDEELWSRLEAAFQTKPRSALTQADLLGLPPEAEKDLTAAELAFRLGSSAAPFSLVLELESREGVSPFLLIQGASLARRHGDLPLAHRLLDRAESLAQGPETSWSVEILIERAATLRRQGKKEEARTLLPRPEAMEELGLDRWTRARINAIRARELYDQGDLDRARELLARDPEEAATAEVRALIELAQDRPARALEIVELARGVALGAEAQARLSAVAAMAHQLRGSTEEACLEFRRAVDASVQSGALLEEATYLTGLAAVTTDAMQFEEALGAAARSSALFEVLGQETRAARALLAEAAVLSAFGCEGELEEVVWRARGMALGQGDTRCAGYLELCLADGLREHSARVAAAERAFSLLTEGDDRLRAEARLHELLGLLPDGADDRAQQTEVRDVKVEWWKARALRAVEEDGEDGREVVAQVVQLSNRGSELAQGPAVVAAAELALASGQVETARRLSARAAALAERFQSAVPDEYRERAAGLAWVQAALLRRSRSFSDAQLVDVESLLRALSHRDGLRPLFRQVLDLLLLWTGVERGLLLLKAPGGKLSFRVGRNLRQRDVSPEQRSLSETLARRALAEGRPIFVFDGMTELDDVHRSVHVLRLRSVLALPLVAGGETFGVAYLDDRYQRGAFGESEIAWASLIGTIAALAIRDARDRLMLKRATRRAERANLRLERALEGKEASIELLERKLREETQSIGKHIEFGIVYESRSMHQLVTSLRKVAQSDVPILITGESGTGKEMVARAVAQAGPRSAREFVAENCAALPESLLESELFGHVRGAFTGASRDRIGLFEMAHGGTLFLDEIGEMALSMQAKLLRVLQDSVVRRVGSEKGRTVDVRIITATHRSLVDLVRENRFREDLYYRLNVVPLLVPPLRERKEDILPLVRHFIVRYAPDRVIKIAPSAARALLDYDWPGNVRQLENEVRRLLVFVEREITVTDLALGVPKREERDGPMALRDRVDALEKSLVLAALDEHRGNRTKMAEALGVSRQGLLKMMRRLGITAEQPS